MSIPFSVGKCPRSLIMSSYVGNYRGKYVSEAKKITLDTIIVDGTTILWHVYQR